MSASFVKTIEERDVQLFAEISGDTNPIHLDEEFAARSPFGGRIAHGMLTAGLISTVIGTLLPGPGAIYLGQNLRFKAPVRLGDTVEAEVTVSELDAKRKRASMAAVCRVDDTVVLDGDALIMVPSKE
ncbi:MAG: MaoC family dehydratase [Alphaproteobacteria bacterium]|nr:MaoC family dehydratase [Alphaproteobacteria bacterium]